MPTTIEREPILYELSPTQQALQDIRSMDVVEDQFMALSHDYVNDKCLLPSELTIDDIHDLINFAADPEASPSLLVRAQAFERAAEVLLTMQEKISDFSPMASLKLEMTLNMPLKFLPERAALIRNPDALLPRDKEFKDLQRMPKYGLFNPHKYRELARGLATKEGIPIDRLFVNILENHLPEYSSVVDDNIPAMALLFLENISPRLAYYDRVRPPLHAENFIKLIPLAIDIHEAMNDYPELQFVQSTDTTEIRKDAETIKFLIDRGDEAHSYIRSMQILQRYGTLMLKHLFSEENRAGVTLGARALTMDCFYAIEAHLANGKQTNVVLPLNESKESGLELSLKDDEPIEMINHLSEAMRLLFKATHEPASTPVTLANEGKGYKIYRLWPEGSDTSSVSVYVRPRGAETYNQSTEYGRNGEGVEASISYVVDPTLPEGKISEIGKHRGRGPDNRISIRLDREGVPPELRGKPGVARDPTQERGTLSLDIGSIIGNEQWLGTKIGRFLAWGNMLRAEAFGQDVHLNHSTHYFNQPLDGSAEVFADRAQQVINGFEARRLSKKQIIQRFSGARAVSGLQKIK